MANSPDPNNVPETPDDPINKPKTGNKSLKFPITNANEVGNWIVILRKQYSKDALSDQSKLVDAEGARQIELPLPVNFQKSYTVDWGEESMGATSNFLRTEAAGQLKAVIKNYKGGNGLMNSVYEQIGQMDKSKLMDFGYNYAQKAGVDMATDNDFFRKVGGFIGYARNPYKAVLFNSPSFRGFQFSWKMMAKNYSEAVAIKDIINEFQLGMSPSFATSFSNDLFAYPDVFLLSISDSSFLFKIKPCVCTQVIVDYHSEGSPVYIKGPKGEKIPASVRVDVEFREPVILTKEDFQSGGF